MSVLFNSVRLKKPKRNLIDLSHEKKLSCNMGDLIPILLQEVVPGDKFRVNSEMLVRFAPLIAPIMHRINVFVHYFFVPNRLVWDSWQPFITGGEDGTVLPAYPTIGITEGTRSRFYKGSLADYMGVPVTKTGEVVANTVNISVLPFRMYQMIWNEYYRDQNL